MFVDKYKAFPKGEENSELAKVFDTEQEAIDFCNQSNMHDHKEWTFITIFENEGF